MKLEFMQDEVSSELEEYVRLSIAHNIIRFRELNELTQKGFSEIVDAVQSHVAMWEKGKRGLSAERVFELSEKMGITPNRLLGFEDKQNSNDDLKDLIQKKKIMKMVEYENYVGLLFMAYQKRLTEFLMNVKNDDGIEVIVNSNIAHSENEVTIKFSVKYA